MSRDGRAEFGLGAKLLPPIGNEAQEQAKPTATHNIMRRVVRLCERGGGDAHSLRPHKDQQKRTVDGEPGTKKNNTNKKKTKKNPFRAGEPAKQGPRVDGA